MSDRNALLLAARFAPAYDETPYDDPSLGAIRTALTGIIEGHRPYPAVVVNRRGEFAVPLRLSSEYGELRLLTTLTRCGTAVDVTVSELRMESFLPADEPTAKALHLLDPAS